MKLTVVKISIVVFGLFAFTQINAQEGKQKSDRPSPEEIFAEIDTNSDNAIDMTEFKAHAEKRKEHMHKKGHEDGKGKKKGHSKHKDHKPKDIEARFAKVDANSNGSIDLVEFKAAKKKKKGKKKGKKGKK